MEYGSVSYSEIFNAQVVARKLLKAKRYQKPEKYKPARSYRDLMGHKAIAAELGLSDRRIQQIERDILEVLKEGARLGDPRLLALRDFLED